MHKKVLNLDASLNWIDQVLAMHNEVLNLDLVPAEVHHLQKFLVLD